MCGIVGLLTRERPVRQSDEECLKRVMNKIAYRGPDGSGVWRSESVLLGHRRLSIIDLSEAGAQPFEIAEKGLAITFNGEIYNFKEIRQTLISHGYTFHSHSDTEVILLAYDHYGIDFLSHFRGMFAFCLFDQKKNIAILARDPAGEKPLYYYLDSDKLIFSSEIKAFHAFPETDLAVDEESVRAFFVLQYIPGPHTIYRQIKRLPAGSALKIELRNWDAHLVQYWSIEGGRAHPSTPGEIEELLLASVRYRLIADVEVGLLLSGGIDSTLLALHSKRAGSNPRVFSAGFERDELDETHFARQIADHLQMQQVVINGGQLDRDTFDQIIFHADEPLGDPACIPTFLLARELSKYVKVVLSGEGADELFWGYDTYRYERVWRQLAWLRPLAAQWPGFRKLVSKWEGSPHVHPAFTRLAKLLSASYDLGPSRWTSVFADHTIDRLMPSVSSASAIYLEEMESGLLQLRSRMNSLTGDLSGDLLYWLADDLLVKVDRMTMAHGVEARAPYLDPDLIAAALALPEKYKMNGSMGKLVLRHQIEKYFPGDLGKAFARRKKHGFEVPVTDWLKTTLREQVEDRLSPQKLSQSGLLDPAYVRNLWRTFLSTPNETPLRRKLWLIVCFQSWLEFHQRHFDLHEAAN
ncbi:MAG: asparagine synthase (glutamine-hydrolyzing) [Anaerolineales bacterium]